MRGLFAAAAFGATLGGCLLTEPLAGLRGTSIVDGDPTPDPSDASTADANPVGLDATPAFDANPIALDANPFDANPVDVDATPTVRDASPDALDGHDGGGGVLDAGADAHDASFCASHSVGLFCSDFDEGMLFSADFTKAPVGAGGTLALDGAGFDSSSSLLSTLPGGMQNPYAYLEYDAQTTGTRAHVEGEFRPEVLPAKGAGDVYFLQLNDVVGSVEFGLQLAFEQGDVYVQEDQYTPTFEYNITDLAAQPVLNAWHKWALDLDASVPQVTVSLDGQVVATIALTYAWAPGLFQYSIGAVYDYQSQAVTVNVDNVFGTLQ